MKHPCSVILCLLLCLLGPHASAAAEAIPARGIVGSPPLRFYAPPETELPECGQLLFDHRGLMLVINQNQVWETDGVTWRVIEPLSERIILALGTAQRRERIYACGFRDIGYVEPSQKGWYEYHDLRAKLPEDMTSEVVFNMIEEDADENLYISNLRCIHRFAGARPARTWRFQGIISHAFIHGGKLHISTNEEGFFRLEGDDLVPLPIPGRKSASIATSAQLPDDRMVLSLDDGRIAILEGESLSFIPDTELKLHPEEFITGLAALPNFWLVGVSKHGHLFVFDLKGKIQRYIGAEHGLRLSKGCRPMVDANGQVWIVSALGIVQVDVLSPISVLDQKHHVGESVARMALVDGQLWVGNTESLRYSTPGPVAGEHQFEILPTVQSVESNMVVHNDCLLFSSSRFEGNRLPATQLIELHTRTLKMRNLGPAGESIALLRRKPGQLLTVGINELCHYRFVDNSWKLEAPPMPTPYRMLDVVEGNDDDYWLTTGVDSVCRLTFNPDGSPHWQRFDTDDGLPKDWIAPRNVGNETIFCTKVGIYRWVKQTQRFEPHPKFADLPEDISAEFVQIRADDRGNLWFSSLGGTGVMRRQTDGSYSWDLLGLRMLGKPNVREILFEEPDIVWLSTISKIIRYDDRVAIRAPTRFAALVREIRGIGNQDLLYGGLGKLPPEGLVLRYSHNDLKVLISSNSSIDPQRTDYSHRIGDGPWSPWARQATWEVSNLHEGEHRLEVRARNVLAQVSEPAAILIRIQPPRYRTWWAYLLYTLGGVGVVWGVGHLRSGYLRRKNATLQRMVDESTEHIREQADELAQANEQMAQANEELKDTNDELATTIQQLTQANHRLEELDREKNEFIGIVSHDLRNPLGAITQAGELLQEEPDLRPNVTELVGLMRQSAEMSLGIVTNLLDLNRIEQGRLVTELKPCDLSSLAARACEAYRERARAKSIELILVAPDPITVQADPTLLEQVLGNLVSNAVKYSPHGRRVWIVCRTDAGKPRCEVRDEGHGIRPEELPKLFRKFSRLSTRPTGGEQSVGLGLAIVQRMVEAMQGRIWCESVHGQGATFIVELPVKN